MSAPAAAAREWCRETLPHVSRTFAISIELLHPRLRETVRIAYLLCRAADALEDSWPGAPDAVAARFAGFLAALEGDAPAAAALAAGVAGVGDRADLRLVAGLPRVFEAFAARPAADVAIVRDGVRTLATGMSRYAARAAGRPAGACYLDDERELSDYCWVVAGCVGAMLTRLFERAVPEPDAARERRHALAPVVGEALQLTNIALDLPGDVRRGRCYLPAAWLAEQGLAPTAFTGPPCPGARELSLRLVARAHAALDQVADYLETLPPRHVRYRLFCLWPALWARASLTLATADPAYPFAAERAKLSRAALWGSAARSLLVAHDHAAVRRLLARA